MDRPNENRRTFLQRLPLAALAVPVLLNCRNDSLAQNSSRGVLNSMRKSAGISEGCDRWCGAANEAPDDVSWKAVLADEKDDGEPLSVTGTVFEADGKRPAPNILIYVYHTDAKGYYGRGGSDHPHGKYHGWMLTDAAGRYEFRTIKPAPYPIRDTPAHIHYTLTGVDFKEYWIDDVWFAGDDLITPEIKRKQLTGRGGFDPIIKLEKGADGIWQARRDIQLRKA